MIWRARTRRQVPRATDCLKGGVEVGRRTAHPQARRLERRGFTAILAADGAEGVKSACEQSPDLILMELSLPVLDGWNATRPMRAYWLVGRAK
jgi:DNA-binding response OmpR family regulator